MEYERTHTHTHTQSIYLWHFKTNAFLASFTIDLQLFLSSASLWYPFIVRSYCPFGPSNGIGVCQGVFFLRVCFSWFERRGCLFPRRRTCLPLRILLLLDMAMISESLYLSLSSLFIKVIHVLFSLMDQKSSSKFCSQICIILSSICLIKSQFLNSIGLVKW